jgi:hypothetical protein
LKQADATCRIAYCNPSCSFNKSLTYRCSPKRNGRPTPRIRKAPRHIEPPRRVRLILPRVALLEVDGRQILPDLRSHRNDHLLVAS